MNAPELMAELLAEIENVYLPVGEVEVELLHQISGTLAQYEQEKAEGYTWVNVMQELTDQAQELGLYDMETKT